VGWAPAQRGGDLPERLRTQVAPGPTAPWRAPDLNGYSKALRPMERVPIDPAHQYDLSELIDVAQRVNPETRVAWERARQAASAVGLAESEYFPVLTLAAFAGYQSLPLPAPQNLIPEGFFRIDVAHLVPGLGLKLLLLDFGRRGATVDAAKERLLAANLGFNRSHQVLAFRVQRAFYAFTGIRARMAVAQASLDAARAVQGAAESRFRQELETLPEVLLARQQAVQAEFDLEDVAAKERNAQVALAESIGISPTIPLQVVDFSALALPSTLEVSVEQVIDRALEQRPDLIAKVALVREKEAALRRARADYLRQAANNAVRRYAGREAIGYLTRGLERVGHLLDTPDRTRLELDFQTALGSVFVATKGHAAPEVERAYSRARTLCHELGETTLPALVYAVTKPAIEAGADPGRVHSEEFWGY
jgi:outer membrane protein